MSRTPKEVSLGLLSAGGSSGNELDIQAEDLDDLLDLCVIAHLADADLVRLVSRDLDRQVSVGQSQDQI